MSTNARRAPLSIPNMVLLSCTTAAAIGTALLGNMPATGILLIIAVGGLISAVLARRAGASDWLRINAIEYRDERDSKLAMQGFAIVGIAALVLSLAGLIAATLYAGFVGHTMIAVALEAAACGVFLLLSIVWAWANIAVLRRM